MTDINVGQLSESLNNKADRDLGNTNPLARTVVEVSDKSLMPSWYRVYSDGWCEQGGRIPNMSGSDWLTASISLLKTFNSNQYFVNTSLIARYTGTAYAVFAQITINTQANNSFTLQTFNANINDYYPAYWQACGYISTGSDDSSSGSTDGEDPNPSDPGN